MRCVTKTFDNNKIDNKFFLSIKKAMASLSDIHYVPSEKPKNHQLVVNKNISVNNIDFSKFSPNLLPILLGCSSFPWDEIAIDIHYRTNAVESKMVKISELSKLNDNPQIYRVIA